MKILANYQSCVTDTKNHLKIMEEHQWRAIGDRGRLKLLIIIHETLVAMAQCYFS